MSWIKEYRTISFDPHNFLNIEKISHVETRDDGTQETIEEEKMVLEGYPIVFNEETLIGSEEAGWIESIDPHALDDADMRDTPLKYNHQDITPILARVKNGSLKLTIDEHGLHMRAELLDTQSNKDFYKMVKAGLLDKMSFGFNSIEEDFDKISRPARRHIRKIGRLFDVSIVDTPAYDGTSLEARSKEIAEARSKAEAEAEARALKELENSNKLEEERRRQAEAKAFEFEKRKRIILLRLGAELRAHFKSQKEAQSQYDSMNSQYQLTRKRLRELEALIKENEAKVKQLKSKGKDDLAKDKEALIKRFNKEKEKSEKLLKDIEKDLDKIIGWAKSDGFEIKTK